jgi:hypothetical protein
MLSNRMTANNRELNPTSHANDNVTNDIRLFHPPGLNNEELISVLIPVSAIFAARTRFDQCTNQTTPQASESAVLCFKQENVYDTNRLP